MLKKWLRRMPHPLYFVSVMVVAIAVRSVIAQEATAISHDYRTDDHSVDLTRLPLGDGNYSTTTLQMGSVFTCMTYNKTAVGAFQEGPWFNGDGTFDLTTKAIVDGEVAWNHEFIIALNSNSRDFTTNDLPNHTTGIYPIASSDDAYQYDRNPNAIAEQTITFSLPANPTIATAPDCLGSEIGILLSGTVLFNAFDAGGRDAVAHETQDNCQGHPQVSGVYHYHSLTNCLDDEGTGHSALMGYAWDGFGIYGVHGEAGKVLTNEDLDECHGHSHVIDWDGQKVDMYHYHATYEFPYTLGCFKGTPTRFRIGGGGEGQGNPPIGGQGAGQGNPPDLAAAAVRLGITQQALMEALGAPPPDFAAAAARLGISEEVLRHTLGQP